MADIRDALQKPNDRKYIERALKAEIIAAKFGFDASYPYPSAGRQCRSRRPSKCFPEAQKLADEAAAMHSAPRRAIRRRRHARRTGDCRKRRVIKFKRIYGDGEQSQAARRFHLRPLLADTSVAVLRCRRFCAEEIYTMPDLGKKYTCYSCHTKFYDLGKPMPICPKCGADQRDAEEAPSVPASRSRARCAPSRRRLWSRKPADEEFRRRRRSRSAGRRRR